MGEMSTRMGEMMIARLGPMRMMRVVTMTMFRGELHHFLETLGEPTDVVYQKISTTQQLKTRGSRGTGILLHCRGSVMILRILVGTTSLWIVARLPVTVILKSVTEGRRRNSDGLLWNAIQTRRRIQSFTRSLSGHVQSLSWSQKLTTFWVLLTYMVPILPVLVMIQMERCVGMRWNK